MSEQEYMLYFRKISRELLLISGLVTRQIRRKQGRSKEKTEKGPGVSEKIEIQGGGQSYS